MNVNNDYLIYSILHASVYNLINTKCQINKHVLEPIHHALESIQRQLRKMIEIKHTGKLKKEVSFYQDKTSVYELLFSIAFMLDYNLEMVDYSSYIYDLTTFEYFLFLNMKMQFAANQYRGDGDTISAAGGTFDEHDGSKCHPKDPRAASLIEN